MRFSIKPLNPKFRKKYFKIFLFFSFNFGIWKNFFSIFWIFRDTLFYNRINFNSGQDLIFLHCRDPPPNNFRLIENPKIPILLIAAGSGIAPFIGFLERWALIGGEEAQMIYGCRDESSFLYKEKLENFKTSGVLKCLNVAFSRIELELSKISSYEFL